MLKTFLIVLVVTMRAATVSCEPIAQIHGEPLNSEILRGIDGCEELLIQEIYQPGFITIEKCLKTAATYQIALKTIKDESITFSDAVALDILTGGQSNAAARLHYENLFVKHPETYRGYVAKLLAECNFIRNIKITDSDLEEYKLKLFSDFPPEELGHLNIDVRPHFLAEKRENWWENKIKNSNIILSETFQKKYKIPIHWIPKEEHRGIPQCEKLDKYLK